MRIRCRVCSAPYIVPDELPPDGAKCPNCDAPAPTKLTPLQAENREPEAAGYSRAVSIVGFLHILVACGGLCLFVGMSAVVSETGGDPISNFRILFGAGWTVVWFAVGIGILRRWQGAWVTSLTIVCVSWVAMIVAGNRNPCGLIFYGLIFVGMLITLIARRNEFS